MGEGWYDHHLGSALESWVLLPPETKAHSVLEIGPWNHGNRNAVICDIPHKSEAGNEALNEAKNRLDWFSTVLVKKEAPEGGVRFYRIHEEEAANPWRSEAAYPVPGVKEHRSSLNDTVTIAPRASAPPRENLNSIASYTYDPDNPVITHGAESAFTSFDKGGSLLQEAPGARDDVLSFIGKPLEEAVNIMGKVRLHLRVASDAADTAFCFKLCEVLPNGEAYNIRNGVATLAFRNGDKALSPYTPGEWVDIDLESWDVSWRLHKGSRLRLDVSSSDFPEYSIHPNSAELWSMSRTAQKARQQVDCAESYLALPERN
jgi:putative CocE/NonD family hydrolase